MIWFIATLLAALLGSVRDGLQKLLLSDIESHELGFFSGTIGAILMTPFGYMYFPGHLTLFLGVLLVFSGFASVIAIWMFLVALDIGEISVITPLRRVSPVIVAVIEPFFLAASYKPGILIGAILCGLGAFITAVKTENITTPLKDLANTAAILAIGVALFKALGSIATVYLAREMNYLFLSFFSLLSMAIGFAAITHKKQDNFDLRKGWNTNVGMVGLFAVLGTILITFAYSAASATQVITVKQSTIIFSILIGGKFFKEGNMMRKIVGSLLIIISIIFVSI